MTAVCAGRIRYESISPQHRLFPYVNSSSPHKNPTLALFTHYFTPPLTFKLLNDMETFLSLGYGWVIFKHCSGWSEDLRLSRHPAPVHCLVFDVITVNFLWDTSELIHSAHSVHHQTACKWLQDSLHIVSHKPHLSFYSWLTIDSAALKTSSKPPYKYKTKEGKG